MDIPAAVQNKARVHGATDWLRSVPDLVDELATRWDLTIGASLDGGTEAHVVAVTTADGTGAVLKLIVPRDGDAARHEITTLQLADGRGCARLLAADPALGALVVERLGQPLADAGLPIDQRHDILCRVGQQLWRPVAEGVLPDGAAKGRWLHDEILGRWEHLGRPCTEAVIDHAVACAERRIAAHDDERAT
ncbi:MAG: aminoglycoside phosphotransferase family protein [Desertimonas sp.]